jgi:hypothetical protein
MAEDKSNHLDDLLGRMPEIAKAVSAFPEGVQKSAFDALMAAATGTAASARAPAPAEAAGDTAPRKRGAATRRRKREAEADTGHGKPRRAGSSQPKVVKELDLRPKGKKTLADFVKEKNPTSQHDKHAVTVYYLSNVAGISPVGRDHVFTAWREMGWKLPPDFLASLRLTASKKRYLDTSNTDDLRLLNPGVNRVEHDLPVAKKKS